MTVEFTSLLTKKSHMLFIIYYFQKYEIKDPKHKTQLLKWLAVFLKELPAKGKVQTNKIGYICTGITGSYTSCSYQL